MFKLTNCNVHVFCKMIFSNKFGFILETIFSYKSDISFKKAHVQLKIELRPVC
jgi:hypothetical protein